jgi:hypothetical protein
MKAINKSRTPLNASQVGQLQILKTLQNRELGQLDQHCLDVSTGCEDWKADASLSGPTDYCLSWPSSKHQESL